MALVRKESTKSNDRTKSSSHKELSKETVSYQEEEESKTKMGPTSSTVEGSK